MDEWSFGEPHDNTETYADGTVVPHRHHISFGITAVVFGAPEGGN